MANQYSLPKRSRKKAYKRSSEEIELGRLLQVARLQIEKCELVEAKVTFGMILEKAKRLQDFRTIMEALSGLLRLAGEALDETGIRQWDDEINQLVHSHPRDVPPMVWYCKGAIARYDGRYLTAQRHIHRYLRATRQELRISREGKSLNGSLLRGWVMVAILFQQRNCLKRSEYLATLLLRRFGTLESEKDLNRYKGILFLLLGTLCERRKDLAGAQKWFQSSHSVFLTSHNWYSHLYVLYGFARLERQKQNFSRSLLYLEWVEKIAASRGFDLLRRELVRERARLDQCAVDLLIDSRKGLIRTRENGDIFIRKQYVLLNILEALIYAHQKKGDEWERGLSKEEIIRYVWREHYEPAVHDNKLYYNINRLRRLIEPNMRKPRYLLNWKKGYRLAPGLRIQLLNAEGHGGDRT